MAGIFSLEENQKISCESFCATLDSYRNGWVTLKPEVAFEVLERHAGKLARVVLRGLGVSNDPWLPDSFVF